VALGPLSRVGDPGAGTAGPGGLALLAPDSVGYLAASKTWGDVAAAPWPRWGYLVILRLGHLLGDAPAVAVAIQVLTTVAVGVLLLREVRELAGPIAGAVAAAVLLVNPMTAQWLRFVLTESLLRPRRHPVVLLAARGIESRADAAALVAVAGVAAVFRPTGPLLACAAVALVLRAQPWPRPVRLVTGATLVAVVAGALLLGSAATGPPAEGSLGSQLRDGVVVEGTADVRTTIAMPPAAGEDVLGYATAHPLAVTRLAAARVAVEVAQVRRHYPTPVNVALGAAMLVFSVLATLGLLDTRGRDLRVPTAAVALPLIGVVAVTFAVPEGRYGWAGLVAVAPAVGVGTAALWERLAGRQRIGGTAR